jgi:hypothetical protein
MCHIECFRQLSLALPELSDSLARDAYSIDAAFENGRYRLEAEITLQVREHKPPSVEHLVENCLNL